MAQFDIEVTTVSWIDKALMLSYASLPSPFESWVRFLGFGMCHTGNPTPPTTVRGEAGRNALARQYRGFTDFSIQLQTASNGKFAAVRRMPNSSTILDPGYTPPFDSTVDKWLGVIGTAVSTNAIAAGAILSEAGKYSPGDKSILSQIFIPDFQWQSNGVPQLPYSSIKPQFGETILGHSLMKFRAGTQGDFIGVLGMGAPNHLPWVWSEALLTYQDSSNVVLYCAGSAFPCHAFYLNGKQQGRLNLTAQSADLENIFTKGLEATIVYSTLPNVDMRHTRPLAIGINPQTPIVEWCRTGQSVQDQPYTAPANKQQLRISIPLIALPR